MRSVPGFGRLIMVTIALVVGGAMASCSQPKEAATDGGPAADEAIAAQTFCPIMWTWVKDIGVIFNDAAADVASIDDPQDRRTRWFEAFAEMDTRNAELEDAISAYRSDPILGPIVAEIERDIPLAADELNDIRTLITESPEIDERRHQDRTVQVVVRIEKVIDLPKPELGPLDTSGTLIAAFQTVPSCQHAVKDVDNGSTQDNG